MEIILLERVENLGQMGDVVKVRAGYARNYLLPQNKALRANDANKAIFETQKADLEARNLERRSEAEKVAEKIDGRAFVLIRQASDAGLLYGSVSTRDIAEAASEDGLHIERGQVRLNKPLKNLGISKVRIVLHPEVDAHVEINVARSEDEAERQARGENVLIREEDLPQDDQEDGDGAEFFDPEAAATETADGEAPESEEGDSAS